MESNSADYQVFQQMPDAKVKITGIRDLREYLGEHIVDWCGLKVSKFVTFGSMVYVYTSDKGRYTKSFYGYIDDVAHNVQMGFYEKGGQASA